MDPTESNACREAASRCRKMASSSTNSKEWIAMAEQWELLADTEQGLSPPPSPRRDMDASLSDFKQTRALP